MEESFRNLIRDELRGCVSEIVGQTATETLNQLRGHKRERNDLDQRSKNLDDKQDRLRQREQELRQQQEDLEQQQSKFKKQREAMEDIIQDKDHIKRTLEFLHRRETVLKETSPDDYRKYIDEVMQLTQPLDDNDEDDDGVVIGTGGSRAQKLVDKIDNLEDVVCDREKEPAFSLSLEESDEQPRFGYSTP